MKLFKIQIACSLLMLLTTSGLLAQSGASKIDSSYHNWYYQQRMDFYEKLDVRKKFDVVFLGNSITERGEWHELLPGERVANRGIGGDNTFGVLARLDNVIALRPKKLFILIGINDLGRDLPVEVVANNYSRIIRQLKKALPKTSIYVQSVLPLNENVLKYDYLKGKDLSIKELNKRIKDMAGKEKLTYIDLQSLFSDKEGQLKEEWTLDGIHLRPVAYSYWVEYLKEKQYL